MSTLTSFENLDLRPSSFLLPTSPVTLKLKQSSPLLYQNLITFTIVADDMAVVYIDGRQVFTSPIMIAHTINISQSFKVVAIRLSNIFGYIGFMAETSSGVVSDETWRCTSKKQFNDNWARTKFNDTSWPQAVPYATNSPGLFVGSFWSEFPTERLWISIANKQFLGFIYCRKSAIMK